ncbi:unnamed protein product [Meloidogyne enterolobii]|uniref:Uncharacterized protein n=1 Tax=Meloidogyne enterolobii TaxID=390850 RepID=A0ACB0ZS89_MELEN
MANLIVPSFFFTNTTGEANCELECSIILSFSICSTCLLISFFIVIGTRYCLYEIGPFPGSIFILCWIEPL